MRLDAPLTTAENRETGLAVTPAGNYIIIGMDACFIPWSPLYKLLHGPHYFIVQKGDAELHDCFDPTYGISGQTKDYGRQHRPQPVLTCWKAPWLLQNFSIRFFHPFPMQRIAIVFLPFHPETCKSSIPLLFLLYCHKLFHRFIVA